MKMEEYLQNKDGEIRKVEDTFIGNLGDKNALEKLTKEMKEFPDEEVYFSCDRSTFGMSALETTELYRAIYGLPQPFYPDVSPEGKAANTAIGKKIKGLFSKEHWEGLEKLFIELVEWYLFNTKEHLKESPLPPKFKSTWEKEASCSLAKFEFTKEESDEFYDVVNAH